MAGLRYEAGMFLSATPCGPRQKQLLLVLRFPPMRTAACRQPVQLLVDYIFYSQARPGWLAGQLTCS